MAKSKKATDYSWPLVALAVVAMVGVALGVSALATSFDRTAQRREETVVEGGLTQRAQEVAQMVMPQVIWDEAVENLDNRFDANWADLNLGQFLSTTDSFDWVFVLDRNNQPIFAAAEAGKAQVFDYWRFYTVAKPLVLEARAAEQARGDIRKGAWSKEILAKPIQPTTFAWVDGQLYIVTASLVSPDFGRSRPLTTHAPIVFTAMAVDGAFLKGFGARYMLQGLHLHGGDRQMETYEAHAPMRGQDGQVIATIDWSPQGPAQAMIHRILGPALMIMAGLSAAAVALYRRARRMSQGLVASEARAAHQACHDALTGLPNRVLFDDRLNHALAQARRTGAGVAVHCIDLDRFKHVNDTYGHQCGDELLVQVARRMASVCRGADTLARLSGDEFVVVQEGASAATAAALAARLTKAMAEPLDLSIGRLFISGSIGIALVADPEIEGWEALRQADLALYRAKDSGKNQFQFFEPEMDAAIKARRSLEADLRAAIDDDALTLAYQPQVDRRGTMTGVEALVRWNHPTRGAISPAFFVPIAEECGLMVKLGFLVMRRAFADSRRWPGLKVAINVSAVQLRAHDFVDRVAAMIDEAQVDPSQFELELTETLLLGDDPITHEQLRRLRGMGFSLALDDFGTGYSSLSYLQRFPISKIKIDRSFVANLCGDGEAEAVVGAIVKLARALRMSVIAEGVETQAQREALASAGCHSVQGFLFSQPIAVEDVAGLRSVNFAKAGVLAVRS